MIYALDSNTIIHLLNYNPTVIAKKEEAVAAGARFIIPPVVDYEIKRGLWYKPAPKKEAIYGSLINHYGTGEMTSAVWARAANIYVSLRRKSLTVGDGDIFIAAFCAANDYTLVTNNTKHFESIDDLRIIDWVAK
jgi:predicted nucleic acid-binding protein